MQYNCSVMVQEVIIIVVSNRYKQVKHLTHALPMQNKDRNLRLGRNEDLTWPRSALITAPDRHLVIVNNGVLDLVLEHGVPDFGRTSFIQKLSRVATNKRN